MMTAKGATMPTQRRHGQGSIIRKPGTDNLYVRWRIDGKQYQEAVGSSSTEAAEKLLHSKIGDAIRGETPTEGAKRRTYEDVRAFYLKRQPRQEAYGGLPFLDKFFKGMRVVNIMSATIDAFIAHRRDIDKVSDATIKRNLTVFRAMFRRAAKKKLIGWQNVPEIEMPTESNEGSGQYVTPEQFAKIRALLPDHIRPFFVFLYATGCRLGAAQKIEWSMVDEDATEINLPGEIVKTRNPLKIVLAGPVLEPIAASLRKRFRDTSKPVFDSTNYRREWAKAVALAGLGTYDRKTCRRTGPRIHDCRVGGAVNLIDSGVPETTVLQIGGWKTNHMLKRYNVLDHERIAEAMRLAGEYTKAREKKAAKS